MLPVPAGKFTQGTDWVGPFTDYDRRMKEVIDDRVDLKQWRGGEIDESPAHEVTISNPYYIAATQVTNAQYEAFDPDHKKYRDPRSPSYADDDAVGNVSWYEAVAFCHWLSEKEGRSYRLPTEAEWEYAARAGATGLFCFGDTLPIEVYHRKDRSVGQTPPNMWGLQDMHCGVAEWCSDWYGPYVSHPQTDPVGRATGLARILRGGCDEDHWSFRRLTNRAGTIPSFRHVNFGFRIVEGKILSTEPLPTEQPSWATNISQDRFDWSHGPDMKHPYFAELIEYAHPPKQREKYPFYATNHCPAMVWCDNGDLIVLWWTCVRDAGRISAILASRLRAGNEQFDEPSLFFVPPDFETSSLSLHRLDNGRLVWLQNIAPGGDWATAPLAVSFSDNNGMTWSELDLVLPDVRPGQPAHMTPFRGNEGQLYQTADYFETNYEKTKNCGGSALYRSDDQGQSWRELTRENWQLENLGKPGKTAGLIAGPHAAAVMLRDGAIIALGRRAHTEGNLILSRSEDGGRSWTYSKSEFPVFDGGQRPSMLRLHEGPIVFFGYTGPSSMPGHSKLADLVNDVTLAENTAGMTFTDVSGRSYVGRGLYAAVSYDEGKTWPLRKLMTPGGPQRKIFGGGHHHHFLLDGTHAEPAGYTFAMQSPDGVIHLISSNILYRFNLKWIETLPDIAVSLASPVSPNEELSQPAKLPSWWE